MKTKYRHNEYINALLNSRKQELINTDPVNARSLSQGEGLTSPTSNLSTEETRILIEYLDQRNLFKISDAQPSQKKIITLKKFFKMKRNQQVEVYSRSGDKSIYTEGKVSAIGRDFVLLTDLKRRYWIPYHYIESANIPYGIPNYSNTHQHYIFDNNIREKLIRNFGETVSKRDVLYQLFNEDSLHTNLLSWKDSWVEINFEDKVMFGKVIDCSRKSIKLTKFKKVEEIAIEKVSFIKTLRLTQIISKLIKLRF